MRHLLVLLAAAGLVAACGSDEDEGGRTADTETVSSESESEETSEDTSDATAVGDGSEGDDDASSGGDLDCAALGTTIGEDFGVPVQLMAQVRDPANFQSIKDGVMAPLDIDAFLAAVEDLRVLEAYESPLGDPGASLDAYEEAGLAMKALMAKDPVTQADIDEYNTHVGEVGEFLGHQIAISGALDAAGC